MTRRNSSHSSRLSRSASRAIGRAASIDAVEDLAKAKLPRMVYDFIAGGAEDERTVAANRADFSDYSFLPRVLADVSVTDQSTTLLGQPVSTPVVLAPVGLAGLADPVEGEAGAAKAAKSEDTMMVLSTASTRSIEDVAQAAPGHPLWFQLYVFRDRKLTESLIERARDAGYRALCLTVDVPVTGKRERDLRNGFSLPPRLLTAASMEALLHPGWLWRLGDSYRRHQGVTFGNFITGSTGGPVKTVRVAEFVDRQFDPGVTWKDVERFRSMWRGPLVVKGVLRAEDARRCAEMGVEAVVVSNHGGRQLDSAASSIGALESVVDAVGDRAEIYVDGGIRRGNDVLKAIALGARACLIGRPYVYGMGAAGTHGVARVIGILKSEIQRSMALLGVSRLSDLDKGMLQRTREELG